MAQEFSVKLIFESDPDNADILNVGIYAPSEAAVQYEIDRIVQTVDEVGGGAVMKGPFPHHLGGFYAGGKMKIDDGVWQ